MSDTWADEGFASVLPRSWLSKPDESTALVFCYRVMRTQKQELVPPFVVPLGEVCAIFLFGSITYLDAGRPVLRASSDAEVPAIQAAPVQATTPEEAHLLLVTPLRVDGADGDENAAAQRLQEAAGIIECVIGRNALYELVFENVFGVSGKSATVRSRFFENPWFFPAPEPRAGSDMLQRAVAALAALDPGSRDRTGLSLRWLHQASFSSGVDGLLRYWIALETLAMPDSTNIKPLLSTLAAAYGLTSEAAQRRFGLGRIFRLRGVVVHAGQMRPIHGALLKLLEGIYVDVLFQQLGLPTPLAAEAALRETDMTADDMLAYSGPLTH